MQPLQFQTNIINENIRCVIDFISSRHKKSKLAKEKLSQSILSEHIIPFYFRGLRCLPYFCNENIAELGK